VEPGVVIVPAIILIDLLALLCCWCLVRVANRPLVVEPRLPVARATRRQLKLWRKDRLVLPRGNRRA
jgi:hypothetical protein